jgi:type VI secretion system protein ImpA
MAELEALVVPIAGTAPAGVNLRLAASDLTFERIQQSRSEVEPAVDPTGVGRSADWAAVARDCEAALRDKSKDLELAVWLTEAWGRTRGFAGLRDGLRLIASLCDGFWDRLHPGLDDGALDLAMRARPLNWLGSSRNMLRSVSACALIPVEVARRSASGLQARSSSTSGAARQAAAPGDGGARHDQRRRVARQARRHLARAARCRAPRGRSASKPAALREVANKRRDGDAPAWSRSPASRPGPRPARSLRREPGRRAEAEPTPPLPRALLAPPPARRAARSPPAKRPCAAWVWSPSTSASTSHSRSPR